MKLTIAFITITLIIITFLMKLKNEFNLDNILNYLTGIGVFLPIFFCDEIIHVFAMGVAMHYVQYIYITKSILNRKFISLSRPENKNIFRFFSPKILFLYLFIYSILMIYFSNLNLDYKSEKFGIYIVPIIFQLLHFYFDMFLWRFSSEHTQKNLTPYLFAK